MPSMKSTLKFDTIFMILYWFSFTISKANAKALDWNGLPFFLLKGNNENILSSRILQENGPLTLSGEKRLGTDGAPYVSIKFSKGFKLEGSDEIRILNGSNFEHEKITAQGPYKQRWSDGFRINAVLGSFAVIQLWKGPGNHKSSWEIENIKMSARVIGEEQSTCGLDEAESLTCRKNNNYKDKVARLLINGDTFCSGFFICEGSGYMLTNEHCVSNAKNLSDTEIHLLAQEPTCGDKECTTPLSCTGSTIHINRDAKLLRVNKDLDYALIELSEEDRRSLKTLKLSRENPKIGEKIKIVHFPDGMPLRISDTAEDAPAVITNQEPKCRTGDATYKADTKSGSSGSPVLNEDDAVIALHHCGGGCNGNGGIKIQDVINDIKLDANLKLDEICFAEAPKTDPPTTEAPTTEAPTTEAPTTEAPTTEAPTTEAPTTEAPTTEAPTAEAPTAEAPTTEASTTEAPTTEAPTTEAPTSVASTTIALATEEASATEEALVTTDASSSVELESKVCTATISELSCVEDSCVLAQGCSDADTTVSPETTTAINTNSRAKVIGSICSNPSCTENPKISTIDEFIELRNAVPGDLVQKAKDQLKIILGAYVHNGNGGKKNTLCVQITIKNNANEALLNIKECREGKLKVTEDRLEENFQNEMTSIWKEVSKTIKPEGSAIAMSAAAHGFQSASGISLNVVAAIAIAAVVMLVAVVVTYKYNSSSTDETISDVRDSVFRLDGNEFSNKNPSIVNIGAVDVGTL